MEILQLFCRFSVSVGENQTKSKEDDLESTLQSYKKNHPRVDFYLLETAKTTRSLRNLLACGQLATEEALRRVVFFRKISGLHSEPKGAIVADFLIDVDVPNC